MRRWQPTKAGACIVLAVLVWCTGSVHAATWKHDEYPAGGSGTQSAIEGENLPVLPGFANGEAFGALFRPQSGDWPVTITGFDLVPMSPPAIVFGTHVDVEIYIDQGDGPGPDNQTPDFIINTSELASLGAGAVAGAPLKGGEYYSADFDCGDADGCPPPATTGHNIWVMVRYKSDAADYSAEWSEYSGGGANCSLAFGCGCQSTTIPMDSSLTPESNVIHILPGTIPPICSGQAQTWMYLDDIGAANPGDFLIRLRVAGSGCTPDCSDTVCGPDGCGGSCGACPEGEVCLSGACQSGDGGDGGTGGCDPVCAGKDCGSDGCGGVCGLCDANQVCVQGGCQADNTGCTASTIYDHKDCDGGDVFWYDDCGDPREFVEACDDGCSDGECTDGGGDVAPTGDVTVVDISPRKGSNDQSTNVSISGTGFQLGLSVKLGAELIGVQQVTGDSLIQATVPEGLEEGTYSVIVINPDNTTATLPNGFEVTLPEVETECGDDICASTENCETCAIDCGPCEDVNSKQAGGCVVGGGVDWALAALAGLLAALAAGRRRRRVRVKSGPSDPERR